METSEFHLCPANTMPVFAAKSRRFGYACSPSVGRLPITMSTFSNGTSSSPILQPKGAITPRRFGRAQLTLVEHALCPLDSGVSLQDGFVHETQYLYSDKHHNRHKAAVRIGGLDGMSAHDELYLWGLLAIALSQNEPRPEIMATPYYCLRQLGIVSTEKRGGREFAMFRAAIGRLAGMRYQNDAFYDPVRGEHREIAFGFLNYSLPLDAESSRAWRFAWDPIFFELAQATGGALSFDIGVYRDLDAATRRFYLYLKKIFWRCETTGRLDLWQVGVDVLGFSPNLETSRLKQKVGRCVDQLLSLDWIRLPANSPDLKTLFAKQSKGVYTFELHRGDAFLSTNSNRHAAVIDSPLVEPLETIGFDRKTIGRVIRDYSATLIEQWADITLAAMERNGDAFFTASPQAYFIDNIRESKAKRRTPPDWWRELRKRECEMEQRQAASKTRLLDDRAFDEYLRTEARETFTKVTEKLIRDLQQAGQAEHEAETNARQMARTHLRNRFREEHPEQAESDGFKPIGSLL